jgi:hypothetical protein
MQTSTENQARVLVGSRIFLKADFERIPLVRRANIGSLASFIDHGDAWRRVDKELLIDSIEYIIAKNRKPMSLSELLRALVRHRIAFFSGLYQHHLKKILARAKFRFVYFADNGYWPTSLPYEKQSHPGFGRDKSARTHDIEVIGTQQPAERGKLGRPLPAISPTPLKPFTPWLRIRRHVGTLELALRGLKVRLQQRSPKQVEVRLPGPEGNEIVERWLLYPTKSLLSIVADILMQEGKPLGADALLERMMRSRTALQTFNQRKVLTEALCQRRRCGELTFVRGQGYWLSAKSSTASFSRDGAA